MKHLAALALFFTACDGSGALTFELTEPDTSVELIPGDDVRFAWTLSGGGTELIMEAVPLDATSGPIILDQNVGEGDGAFTWTGIDAEGTRLPPDVYTIEIEAVDADTTSRTVTLHGMYFTDPAAGETATATGTYELHLRTVSLRPLDLAISLGDHVIATPHINGEFVPFDRVITFDGTDTGGVGVPAGVYPVTVDADDGAFLHYTVTGGMLDWTP